MHSRALFMSCTDESYTAQMHPAVPSSKQVECAKTRSARDHCVQSKKEPCTTVSLLLLPGPVSVPLPHSSALALLLLPLALALALAAAVEDRASNSGPSASASLLSPQSPQLFWGACAAVLTVLTVSGHSVKRRPLRPLSTPAPAAAAAAAMPSSAAAVRARASMSVAATINYRARKSQYKTFQTVIKTKRCQIHPFDFTKSVSN